MSNDKLDATFHGATEAARKIAEAAQEPVRGFSEAVQVAQDLVAPMSQWLSRQPEFKPGQLIPRRVGQMRAEDFNDLRAALNKPNLGLATTRELLEELRTRGDLEVTCDPGTERAHQGHVMSGTAMGLLDALSPEMLGYTTLGGFPDGH